MFCTYFSPVRYDGNQIEEDEMSGACTTNGAHNKFTLIFNVKI
jgi:hypothetical protein